MMNTNTHDANTNNNTSNTAKTNTNNNTITHTTKMKHTVNTADGKNK